MNALQIAPCLLLAALVASCAPAGEPAPPKRDAARVVDAIKTAEVHWNADWKSGDPGKVAAHYATGATFMAPGEPPMVGVPAIRAGVQEIMDDPGFTLTFASDKVDVAASGDLAATHGSYTLTAPDPKTKALVTSHGSVVTVYKPQADGVWRAVWDISTPSAGGAAAAVTGEDEPTAK